MIGVPSAFFWDRCLKRPHRAHGLVPSTERSRHWWDSAADLWLRTVENRVAFPVGVSLVAVAEPLLEWAPSPAEAHDSGGARRRDPDAYEPMASSR